MGALLDALLPAAAGLVLGLVVLALRDLGRTRRARAWAQGRRDAAVAVVRTQDRARRGEVRVDGDQLVWRARGQRWRTPLRVPPDVVVRTWADGDGKEVWHLETYAVPGTGERVGLGVPLDTLSSLADVRGGSRRGAERRRPWLRPAAGVLGALVLLGAAAFWAVWLTSTDVMATVVRVDDELSCVVTWVDPETRVGVTDVTVDCSEVDGHPVRPGDHLLVRAHRGPFRGEGASYEGASAFLRWWLGPIGLVLLAAPWATGLVRLRSGRGDPGTTLVPVTVLEDAVAGAVPPSPDDPGPDPGTPDLVALALAVSGGEGWDDMGDPDPRADTSALWPAAVRGIGGWWALAVPAGAWAAMAPDQPGWWDAAAIWAITALVVLQLLRAWRRHDQLVERRRRPWGAAVDTVGTLYYDAPAVLVLIDRHPRWVVPCERRPPRRARLQVRGELGEGELVDLRSAAGVWSAPWPVEAVDEEELAQVLEEALEDRQGLGGR